MHSQHMLLLWLTCMPVVEVISTDGTHKTPDIWSNQLVTRAYINQNSHWMEGAYAQQEKVKMHWKIQEYPHLEDRMISDLLKGSVHTKHMNYLLFNFGENIICTTSLCEKYLGSVRGLKMELENRGQRLDVQDPGTRLKYQHLNEARIINAGSSNKDVALIKFSHFTMVEEGILRMIRKFNMKSYIVIITDSGRIFHKVKKYLLATEMFNIYILAKTVHKEPLTYNMFEICAFCHSGVTKLNYYNTWTIGQGFIEEIEYTSSFKGQFFGGTVRVGLRLQLPVFYIKGLKADGEIVYAGSEYMVLQTLSQSLNFKILLKHPVEGEACYHDSNFKLEGYCRMLVKKEVDLAGLPVPIRHINFPYADPTAIYYSMYRFIISAKPPLKMPWAAMVSSADPVVFLMILMSYLILTHLYWAIGKFWFKDTNVKYIDALINFYSILFLESVSLHQLRSIHMLLIGVWMVVCYLVISIIFGEITAIASSSEPSRKPIDSVEDMIRFKISWVTAPIHLHGSNLENIPGIQHLEKRKKIMTDKEGLEYVISEPNEYIFYGLKEILEPLIRIHFLSNEHGNPFHFSPPVDVPYLLTILVRKDAPYRDAITDKLLQVNAAALLAQKFVPDSWEVFGKDIKTSTGNNNTFQPTGIQNMFIAFVIYLVAIMLSGFAFVLEHCWKKTEKGFLYKTH